MNLDGPKRKNEDEVVFYARNRWLLLVGTGAIFTLTISLFLWGLRIFNTYQMDTLTASVCLGVTFIVLLIPIVLAVSTVQSFRAHMIIQPNGLVWVKGRMRRRILWDEISRVCVKSEGKVSRAGLMLGKTDFVPVDEFVYIPRPLMWQLSQLQEIDTLKFQQTPFGSNLYRYAPHLFQEIILPRQPHLIDRLLDIFLFILMLISGFGSHAPFVRIIFILPVFGLMEVMKQRINYLVIRCDGIEWVRGGSSSLKTSWDTIQGFQTYDVSRFGSRSYKVVYLKLSTIDFIPFSEYARIPWKYVHVPNKNFADRLRTLRLALFNEPEQIVNMEEFEQTFVGAKLYQYAPHLLEGTSVHNRK